MVAGRRRPVAIPLANGNDYHSLRHCPRNRIARKPFWLMAIVNTSQTSLCADDPSIEVLRQVESADAHQAVAVDANSFYAISSRAIARYDKRTDECLVRWQAAEKSGIRHLNSGAVIEGRLYCANSNWPQQPLANTIEIFDPETL